MVDVSPSLLTPTSSHPFFPPFCTGQKITFEEFLPALLGHEMGPYPGYDPSMDPRVSVEFATVGFSLSHSMATSDVKFMDDKAFAWGSVRCAFPASAVVYWWWCVSTAHVYCSLKPVRGSAASCILVFLVPTALHVLSADCGFQGKLLPHAHCRGSQGSRSSAKVRASRAGYFHPACSTGPFHVMPVPCPRLPLSVTQHHCGSTYVRFSFFVGSLD